MRSAAVLPLCLSLLLAASPLRGQAPERSDRFGAAIRDAAGAPTPLAGSLVPAEPLERSHAPPTLDPGDSREGFALLLGAVTGGLAGVWVGCAIADCTGDGPPPAALRGLLIGIPVGAALTFSAVRAERPR